MTLPRVLRVVMIGLAGFASVTSAQDYAAQQRKAAALLDAGVIANIGNRSNAQ